MSSNGKHTIYIDVDDEITSIIDKVKSAPDKIVALVLPKRATVLQSIVNMKLLKKSAATAKKSIVLITSEAGLMPLAGAVGLHVAKTLQSKPEIPSPPDQTDTTEPVISEDEDEPVIDKSKAVGTLAASKTDDDMETIELDDAPEDDVKAETGSKKKKSAIGFKVPNFDKFRTRFFLGIGALILLLFAWFFAAVVMPKAVITISTDTSTVTSSISFNANTATQNLDVDKAQVPAVVKELKKTDTESISATGKKDNGEKATGTITAYNCTDDPVVAPAGTLFSNSGYSFSSNQAVTVPASDFTSGGICKKNASASIAVTAVAGGTASNLSAGREYTSNFASTLSGTGSAMTGGTTNLVTVVSQDDVDSAVARMKGRLDQDATNELKQQLQSEGLQSLDETRTIGSPVVKATPTVGEEATDVTVTAETTYSVLGVRSDYLSQLIKKDVSAKIDTEKQSILDDGLSKAALRLEARKSPTEAQLTLQSIAIAGPELNEASIKDQIRGKKRGDAEKLIGNLPGVKDVTIEYKPFWVLSTPKAAKKIIITIEKPTVNQPSENDSGNGGQ